MAWFQISVALCGIPCLCGEFVFKN